VNKGHAMRYLFSGLLILSFMMVSSEAMAQSARKRKQMGNLTLKKLKSAVPPAQQFKRKQVRARNVGLIKPPSSKNFYVYDDNPLKTEYNRLGR
jgi:hypothetical protein